MKVNLKRAYEQGFRITEITYVQCLNEYKFSMYREEKRSGTFMDIWLKKLPNYINKNYFENKNSCQKIKIILYND